VGTRSGRFHGIVRPGADASAGSGRGVLNGVWPPALVAVAIWMIVGIRRQLRSRTRWLLYPVIAVLVLASIGGGSATIGEAVDANAYPMPGQLIDVGGHSLHLSCTRSGTPTVVLEAGGGEMSSNMGWIAWTQGIIRLAPRRHPDRRPALAARGPWHRRRGGVVVSLLVEDAHVRGLRLHDGRTVPRDALFVPPRLVPNNDLLLRLGCELDEQAGRSPAPVEGADGAVPSQHARESQRATLSGTVGFSAIAAVLAVLCAAIAVFR